jgi:hypothetical protein
VTVTVAILDAQVGKVKLVVEVRQIVFLGPFPDLVVGPIRVAVVVIAVAIALMEPALVLAFELMIQHDPLDPRVTLGEPLRGAFVGAIDLKVVFELPFAFDACPEGLAVTLVPVPMVFEDATAVGRQRHGVVARAGYSNRLHEALLAEVPQVTRARIARPVVVVAEIPTGDHTKGADGRKRPRF